MGERDWFRNDDWSAAIEAEFEVRRRRARDKAQPLKVQAALLADTRPDVALRLLERYFASGDTFFLADAYSTQAAAHARLGDVVSALTAYRAALAREDEFPNLKTNSFVEYPLFVAEHEVTDQYGYALRVLAARAADLAFPVQYFKWHAARALISFAQGEGTQAEMEAQKALQAAGQLSSSFRNHRSFGLVGSSYVALRARLKALSA